MFNLGSGRGHSVRDVIDAVGAAAGQVLPMAIGPRRPGDVAEMVADSALARMVLGWVPRFGLRDIAAHALAWERRTYCQEADNDDSKLIEVADRMVGQDA